MTEKKETREVVISTAAITAASIIGGVVLIALGHEAWGGALLAFATGAASTRPLIRRTP